MEIFEPISEFYKAIGEDARIGSTHISLYFALLHQWNRDQSVNPFLVVRAELMKTAKINARHTYNKCMNELSQYGYINYTPSSNPLSGSTVHLKFMEIRKESYGKK